MPQITPLTEVGETLTISPQTTAPSRKMQVGDISIDEKPKVEAPKVEAQPPAKTEEKVAEPPKDERLLATVRKEKEILRQKRELAQQKKLLEQQLAEIKPFKDAAEAAKSSKLEALKRLGINYDDVTQEILTQGAPSPEAVASKIVDDKLNEFNQKLIAENQRLQEQQYQQALHTIRSEAESYVNGSQDFPLVKEVQGYDTIMRRIEAEFHASGRIMSVEEATKEYETFLENEISNISSKHEKLRSRLLPKEEPKQGLPQVVVQQQKQQTLTNRQAVSPQVAPPKNESWPEKRARLIQKYNLV